MMLQVGIMQFSTGVHVQVPLCHLNMANLVDIMTDMVSMQLAVAMQH